MPTLADRFAEKWTPEPFSGCWLWTDCLVSTGYGFLWPNKKAHRVSWELHRGSIPEGMHVLHRCDTPSCVNPDHLFIGTNVDNHRDAAQKGRMPKGENNPAARLTEEQVRQIRLSKESIRKLGVKLGVSHRTVNKVRLGETWRHVN